jgi:hypothetical protein
MTIDVNSLAKLGAEARLTELQPRPRESFAHFRIFEIGDPRQPPR